MGAGGKSEERALEPAASFFSRSCPWRQEMETGWKLVWGFVLQARGWPSGSRDDAEWAWLTGPLRLGD